MNTAAATNTMAAFTDIATLSAEDMLKLRARADARVADILGFTTGIEEFDWYLRHYEGQREECLDEGDITGAILAEFILTGLERALTQ